MLASAWLKGWNKRSSHTGVDADAGVANADAHVVMVGIAADELGGQFDMAAFGELDRIAQQVVDDLAQAQTIDDEHRGDARIDALAQQDALLTGDAAEGVVRAVEHFRERGRFFAQFELARFDLGKVEHVVDQAQQRLARVADRVDGVALLGIERAQAQQLEQADHGVHRRADLVAHHGQECALGLAASLGSVARLAQLVLGEALLGDIDADRDDAAVGQRHDAHFEGAAFAARALEAALDAAARHCHLGPQPFHFGRAEFAAFGVVVKKVLQGAARPDQLGGDVQQSGTSLVRRGNLEVLVDQRNAHRQCVEQGLQKGNALVLGRALGEGGLRCHERLLGHDALGHVAAHAAVAGEAPVGGKHRLAADVDVAHAGRGRAPQQQVAERAVCFELGPVQLPRGTDRLGVRQLPARLAEMIVALDAAVFVVGRVDIDVDKAELGVLIPEPARRQAAQREKALPPHLKTASLRITVIGGFRGQELEHGGPWPVRRCRRYRLVAALS